MFTIMIVDDNEQLQNEIGNLLLINGYSILKPKNFKEIAQIVKDDKPDLILARINALIKRAYPNDNNMDIIEHNGLTLNILSSTIEHNEKSIELTKNELKILYYLLVNKGKIVSRVEIMEYLWDSAMFINDNTLTVNITRIRNKIDEIGLKDYIKTKRGQGYII